jgi:hypothetical protein
MEVFRRSVSRLEVRVAAAPFLLSRLCHYRQRHFALLVSAFEVTLAQAPVLPPDDSRQ